MAKQIRTSRRPYMNMPLAPSAIEIITREADELGVSKGAYVSMVILGRLLPPSSDHPGVIDSSAVSAAVITKELDDLQVDDTAA